VIRIISKFVYAHNDRYTVTRMLTNVCEYRSTQQFKTLWLQHFIQKEKLIYSGRLNFNSVFYIVTILRSDVIQWLPYNTGHALNKGVVIAIKKCCVWGGQFKLDFSIFDNNFEFHGSLKTILHFIWRKQHLFAVN